jgi:hypothetical protein
MATGVPYVLDFRDPWGLGYYPQERKRPAWAKRSDDRIIAEMFAKARSVVFLFESVAESYLRAFPGALDKTKVHVIPNGFDGAVEPFANHPGERCTVLYAGTLASYRYDTLLEGLVQLKRHDPVRTARLRLLFVGEKFQALIERAHDLGVSDLIETMPPVTNAEIRRIQQEAHALLVLGRMPERTGHELVAGAKLFGYLQAGRPIIGIVPYDETRRILQKVESSLIADADSPNEVVDTLNIVLDAWSNGALEGLVPNRFVCEGYSSSQQISNLIDALNGASPVKMSAVDL